MEKDYLIVEDSTERLKRIANHFDNFIGKTFDIAFKAKTAISLLKENTYKVIFLDHDLEPEHYEKQMVRDTGQDVCNYLVDNKIQVPKIVIHSLNTEGREKMMEILKKGNYDFLDAPYFWDMRYGYKIRKWVGFDT